MQFHLNGFRVGDPTIEPAISNAHAAQMPEKVDVLIVGSGPAGVVLAAQLSQFPSINTRIVERRDGPLQMGQADGVACRTVEMFNAFGLADRLLQEAYWVNETVFWRPDANDRGAISRTGRVQDTETGLSEFPHVIVNQARIQEYLLDVMRRSARRIEPDYGLELVDVQRDDSNEYPMLVTLRRTDPARLDETVTVRARYVVGCDGARSRVRTAIGQTLRGDAANHAWGVMDALAVTDFPDIRLKAAIQSASKGNLLIIPREGGYLVRFYVDLGDVTPENRDNLKQITVDRIIETAQSILHPYTLDVKEVAWFSVYEVGQRLTDRFDDAIAADGTSREPRVFIAGDACHTHSAKAGQGMNVSMQDGFNLGWKLGAVLEGRSDADLLRTYSDERQPIAQELIDFDKEWSAMMAAPPKDPNRPEAGGVDPAELQAYFVRAGRYTAGVATRYRPATLTGEATHQALAKGFTIGTRFHSSPVVRLADAKPFHLGHAAQADGRWRLYAFADASGRALNALCEHLDKSPESVLRLFTPKDADVDSVLDLRAVLQQPHREVRLQDIPALLLPRKGRHGLIDYEKAFTSDATTDIFDERGIDREQGALVVVRPDQYVAHVLPLNAYAELNAFFRPIFRAR
ncbi:phenol 2-monooxygenase [Paraburkholderia atlantica]|uniref:Phenol 2-monooxygenase n=1 Tax=Paraburkholderia atlantica TaxID=2654982 RepID=A0A6I1Q135_PARAM|nr:FAD-binding monooxygenase [Paraburkholderia atlantica]MBB5426829.1 phenol 2-monooxygenase [Paraburkholderia atlantica]MPW08879.1 3-hydroxybenzoate 4-monooxygenase [Paraburkholderia atlantica]NUY33855.1 3-hydroxybenzoate 4-monooxygenase [Paraburkholderia atlantica]